VARSHTAAVAVAASRRMPGERWAGWSVGRMVVGRLVHVGRLHADAAAAAAAMPPSCCIDLANMHFYSLTTRPANSNSNSNNGNKFLYFLYQADGNNTLTTILLKSHYLNKKISYMPKENKMS